ncbi:MAG: diacylglycerol/polyprenol kinase family protein [Promethearchaeota archaeon]
MVNLLIGFGIPNWAWDIIALVITFLVILILIRVNDILRKREIIPIYISRKVIHIFAAPIFLVCWLLFSGDYYSRYFAMMVPLLFVLLFIGIGTGMIKNEEFVNTMSREGKPSELLKGTLFYAVIMVLSSIFFWYVPVDGTLQPRWIVFIPTAVLIFGPLAGGDGFADLIGRRFGKWKFHIFAEKSLLGTLSMFIFSLLGTLGLLFVFWLVLDPIWASVNVTVLLIPIIVVSLVCTIIEVFSPQNMDNLLIPLFAVITLFVLALVGLYPYPIWHTGPLP